MRATAFINEHTAELILVPELIRALQPFYQKITLIYYWISREGGLISRGSFVNRKIKLLVLYARRPKVEYPDSSLIYIKLNQILFDRALVFHHLGIPVIAGFPLASKLEDVYPGVHCIWLNVEPQGNETIIEVNIESGLAFSPPVTLLSSSDIAEQINNAKNFDWATALEKINEVRRSETSFRRFYNFMSGDLYKPVYLLIHTD